MNKRHKSARASAIQGSLLVILICLSAIFFALGFGGASVGMRAERPTLVAQNGFYPPLPKPDPNLFQPDVIEASPTPAPSPTAFNYIFFYQNFDYTSPPNLPSGWNTSFSSGAADCTPAGTCALGTNWVTSKANPAEGPISAFHDAPACVTDSVMDTPYFYLPSGFFSYNAIFVHSYNLENGRDGAVLEISINGGRYIDIVQAGGFVNYNGVISTSFQSPIAGRSAWTGNSGGYVTAGISFPSIAFGQQISLRFRLATDCSGGGDPAMGWYIDVLNFWIPENQFPPSPTPSPGVTPTPTPPPPVCNFNQSLDNVGTIPSSGWGKTNNSSPRGLIDWFQGIPAMFGAQAGGSNAYIAASFNAGAGTSTISDWLLTPPITLADGAVFTFWTRTVGNPTHPDRLQVRMSPNGSSSNVGGTATSVGDFATLLLDINPTYTTNGYPNTGHNTP